MMRWQTVNDNNNKSLSRLNISKVHLLQRASGLFPILNSYRSGVADTLPSLPPPPLYSHIDSNRNDNDAGGRHRRRK